VTGVIAWTPDAAGEHAFELRLQTDVGEAVQAFVVAVAGEGGESSGEPASESGDASTSSGAASGSTGSAGSGGPEGGSGGTDGTGSAGSRGAGDEGCGCAHRGVRNGVWIVVVLGALARKRRRSQYAMR
jgi:MYXO-CTERM domain-containing protein